MNAVNPLPRVVYTQTQLGGGTTAQGVSYPGGLDQTTPSLRLQPGIVTDGLNFECAQSGGYGRIAGYERVDGRAAPSAATYIIIQVASFTNVPAVGATVTQAVSGATGQIIAVVTTGTPYLAVTLVTGAFDTSHNLTTPGPVTIGTAVPQTIAPDLKTGAQYLALAATVYRNLIGAVPGSGNVYPVALTISGVDNLFAFRANVGNTAVNIYKTTAGGWVQVPFFNLVNFTVGGIVVPLDGETLTQGGVTATIKRVMWRSGLWSGNNAAGGFVITNPAGGNFAAGGATLSGGATVTLSGAQTAITLAPGGRFEFVKCNFSGQLITRRIYGCDGVNQCFEFDGTTLAPITTGLSPDAPSHITFHKNFLFVAQASSISYCGVGTPFKWSATDGGGEIATGDIVNAMLTLPGSQTTATLGVYMQNNTAFLYGTDPSTFNFVSFNNGIGALAYSVQNLFDSFAFDTLGVITLRTTLNWGNFLPTTLTKNILPFVIAERSKLVASSIARTKSQYRAFFSDGYGLYLTMINQQYLGAMPVLFPNPVCAVDVNTASDESEATYFGSSDGLGYVYQLDKGTSFDGAAISAYLIMAWDPVKSPRVLKRFRAASIEVQGSSYAEIQYGYKLGYGSALISQQPPITTLLNLSAFPHWDSFTWDNFTWDGSQLIPSDVDVTGTGENIQPAIVVNGDYMQPFIIDSIIHHYSMRRGIRV